MRSVLMLFFACTLAMVSGCGGNDDASGGMDPDAPLPSSWFDEYRDDFRSDRVSVEVIGKANARNYPTSRQTSVIATYYPTERLDGRWVAGADPTVDWFRTDDGLYIWSGNLTGPKPDRDYSSGDSDGASAATGKRSAAETPSVARSGGIRPTWPDRSQMADYARKAAPNEEMVTAVLAKADYTTADAAGSKQLYWSMCDDSCPSLWQSAILLETGKATQLCVRDDASLSGVAIWYEGGREVRREQGACPSRLRAISG